MGPDRVRSAAAVAAIHALIGYALIVGLRAGSAPEAPAAALKLLDLAPEPPPPPLAEPAKVEARRDEAKAAEPEGAASPKNLRDTPSPVVAPPPAIVLPVPSPVIAAPVAAEGNRAAAGASDVPGPGTGSGGVGTGRGSGEAGNGTGGGGGGGMARPARYLRGRIYDSDKPRSAVRANATGIVYLSFVVGPDGRVARCGVTRSSGHPVLDDVTCRLIKRRLRYRPALNGDGEPIAQTIVGDHEWYKDADPEPIDIEPTIPDDAP